MLNEHKVLHIFNLRPCYLPSDDFISSQSWVLDSYCDKKQVKNENLCGTGNEGGSVPARAHILLISNCGYLQI